MAEKTLTVTVRIHAWKVAKNGNRYGVAEVLSPDISVEKAMYYIDTHGWEPPLDEEFACLISEKGSWWQVVGFPPDPEDEATEVVLTGVCEGSHGKHAAQVWRLRVSSESDDPDFMATLTQPLLKEAGLIDIEPGAHVHFEALKSRRTCTASKIISPTAHDALDPGEQIAFVRFDWPNTKVPAGAAKIFSEKTKVWLGLNIEAALLKRCGIDALSQAVGPWPASLQTSHTLIEQWQTTLREGDQEQIQALRIDRLRVTVRPYKTTTSVGVNLEKLVAPLQIRHPFSPDEVIDWVDAVICDIQPAEKKKTTSPDFKVTFKIKDPRLGRGEVCGNFFLQSTTAADLKTGVPCVVDLAAYTNKAGQPTWTIHRLHRSQPLLQNINED
ncbi:hypothetical protein [uncultured Pseudomonas sp.]|uniref:hypothetical protein n=1 Tax=uncultured Pseudomonas sp. TaxID=114707 RepID=UPI0025E730A7|nr:hypothetical protein [uncultured Pseudomonas sp.]